VRRFFAVVAAIVGGTTTSARAQRTPVAQAAGARSADLQLLLGTAGVKFNPKGNLLVSASVLFPLTNAGLRSRVTTMIGVDYVIK